MNHLDRMYRLNLFDKAMLDSYEKGMIDLAELCKSFEKSTEKFITEYQAEKQEIVEGLVERKLSYA